MMGQMLQNVSPTRKDEDKRKLWRGFRNTEIDGKDWLLGEEEKEVGMLSKQCWPDQ